MKKYVTSFGYLEFNENKNARQTKKKKFSLTRLHT